MKTSQRASMTGGGVLVISVVLFISFTPGFLNAAGTSEIREPLWRNERLRALPPVKRAEAVARRAMGEVINGGGDVITPIPDGYSAAVEADLVRQVGLALTNGDLSAIPSDGEQSVPFGSGSSPCSGWPGVSCTFINDKLFVYGLSFTTLRNGTLAGTLSSSLSSLAFLTQLEVRDIGITGTLPALSTKLRYIGLQNNQISGTIPTGFRPGRGSATDIYLNHNKLSGTIPADLFVTNANARINLSQNNLVGTLPTSITAIHGLEDNAYLDISSNSISGYLPTTWLQLGSPTGSGWTLDLSNNYISGLLPSKLLNNTYYSNIILKNNLLSGALPQPAFVDGQTSVFLTTLDITDNSISGFLPTMVAARTQVPTLTSLLASSNAISGFINQPFLLGNPSLQNLMLADNRLSGILPPITGLHQLDITRNNISGSIPRDLEGTFPFNLNYFKAGFNRLSGEIAPVLVSGSHDILEVLDLSHNNLQGTIPDLYSPNFSFNTLDLSHNRFSGTIPDLPDSLQEIYLNNNFLTGAIYPDRCGDGCYGMPSFARIYAVNGNQLTWVPSEVLMYSVEELYAQENSLSGEIDLAITCAPNLRILDLSSNALTGSLPAESTSTLEVLDVSGNGFSGPVPPEYGLAQLTTLKLSNNLLSGPLPTREGIEVSLGLCSEAYPPQYGRRLLQRGKPVTAPFEKLEIAHFDHNTFEGTLDLNFFLSNTPALQELKLSDNALAGSIFIDPQLEASLPTLLVLDLGGNLLDGTIDSSLLTAFPNLWLLALNSNFFSGTIMPELGVLPFGLRRLKLDSNRFDGLLPPTLSSLSYLEELTLSLNNLVGTIPGIYGNLASLTALEVFANEGLEGCIPSFPSLNVSAIDIKGTNLTGPCTDDVVPPAFVCPPPTTLPIDAELFTVECGVLPAPIQGVEPLVVDPCPANVRAFLTPNVTDASGEISVTFFPTTFLKGVRTTVIWDAQDGRGNRATCESALTLVTQLELVAIEVTQSVQDWNHTVPLVAKKATMVRAFVQLPDSDDRNVTVDTAPLLDGYLRGVRNGVVLGNIAKVNVEGAIIITKYIRAGRAYIRGSFNFLMPEAWVAPGTLQVCYVPIPTHDFPDISPVACLEQDNDGDCCISVTFRSVSKPYLRFIRVRYRDENNVLREVSDQVLREQWRRFRSMLPIPADSLVDFRQFDFVYASRPPLRVVNNALDATRIIDNLPQRCWYIGVLKGMGGGLAELGGETAAYYAGSAENSYSCGYERNRGIHEFLHNMGIEHIRQGTVTACSTVPNTDPTVYPFLEALDSDGLVVRPTLGPLGNPLTEVFGTDPQLAATGAPSVLAFMSPRVVFALMSYCQPLNFFGCQARWIDRDTYDKVLQEIDARAPAGPQAIGADTPADISMFRGSIEFDGTDYNVVLGPLLQVCTTSASTGKDVGTESPFSLQVIKDGSTVQDTPIKTSQATADLIECTDSSNPNCATVGASDVFGSFSQDGEFPAGDEPGCAFCFASFDYFPSFSFDFLPTYSFDAFPIFSFDFLPTFSFDGYPFISFDNASYMLFDGFPFFGFDEAGLPKRDSAVPQGTFVSSDFGGFFEEVAGNFSDFDGVSSGVAGASVQRFDFQLARESVLPDASQQVGGAGNDYSVQFTFEFELQQIVIAMFDLSANAPTIANLVKTPAGAIVGETEVELCFDISDADGGNTTLFSTIQYCPDYDGTLCSCEVFTLDYVDAVVANNAIARTVCITYEKKKLKASSSAVFRVYVSDGLRTADALSANFTVSNNPPEVEIVFPTGGTKSGVGINEVFLSGSAYDLEDGPLSATCEWFEATNPSVPRPLATGLQATVTVKKLRGPSVVGNCETTHTIRLVCADSQGAEDTVEVEHTILGGGTPIILCPPTIIAIADNNTCSAQVTYPNVTAATSCGADLTASLVSPSWAISGAVFPGGDTIVRYRAAEELSNQVATCSFIVRVADTQSPTMSCNNITVPAVRRTGTNGGSAWYDVPVADNCGVRVEGSTDRDKDPGDVIPFGTHAIEYWVEDFDGNTAMCEFELTVNEIQCSPGCAGAAAGFALEFGLTAGSVGPVVLSQEQVCLWNYIVGGAVGASAPDDPCIVSSVPVSKRRRSLQQSFLDVGRTMRVYFPTEAAARAAELALREASANGGLLGGLQSVLAFLNSLVLGPISVVPVGGATSDPHFQGPCGQHFDFMGAPGESFCLMTSEAVHINGKMMGPRTSAPRSVVDDAAGSTPAKNTWIQELGILYNGTNITVSAESLPGSGFKAYHGRVYVNGVEITNTFANAATVVEHGLKVDRRKTRVKLTLGDVATLQVEVVRASFWEAGHGPGGNFLNLKVLRLANAADWHGVLGQTFGKPCDSLASSVGAPMGAVAGSNATKYSLTETDMYRTSGILAGDCTVSKFRQHQ
eukprot:jgi/Mesvir1/16935/Mv15794-RA.1